MENHDEEPVGVDALKLIDIRLLSQPELLTLSLCSIRPTSSSASASLAAGKDDDLLTPKIDRSVFNESAGSRKQTFSRLRLSRHPSPTKSTSQAPPIDENIEVENAQILPLFKSLFLDSSNILNGGEEEKIDEVGEDEMSIDQKLLPVPVRYMNDSDANADWETEKSVLVRTESPVEPKRRRGRPPKNQNPKNWATESNNARGVAIASLDDTKNIIIHSVDARETTKTQHFGTETRRKRGRPPKIKNPSNLGSEVEGDKHVSGA